MREIRTPCWASARMPAIRRSKGVSGAGPQIPPPDNYVNNPLADLAEEKMKKSTRHTRLSRSSAGGGGYQQQSSGYHQGGYQQQQQRQYGGEPPPSPGCGTSSTWGT